MLNQITNILIDLVNRTGYVGIFLATMIESFFTPIPSEIILLSAGLAAKASGQGEIALALMVLSASLGSYVGTLPFYAIARWGAETILPKFLHKYGAYLLIDEKDLAKSHTLFEKHGGKIVFLARLVPTVRSLVAFPAGAAKMSLWKYTFYTMLGSSLWNLLLGGVGFYAYDYKDQLFALLEPFERIILVILAVLVLLYIYRVIYQMRKIRAIHQISA